MVREAKSLSMINDPSLVRVFDAGEHDGHFFMVMEYIDGCPLKTLAEERALPLGVVLSLIRQVCLAVHVLHQLGHVHRDIKPDNIMILENADGAWHLAKLIDLGIAKIADFSTTSGGLPMGTVNYMAPEQICGDKVDARTDIFPIGLILYELIARCHPHEINSRPASRGEWAQRQLNYKPAPLIEIIPTIHPSVSEMVERAMAKKAEDRFKSAAELAETIDRVRLEVGARGELGAMRLDPFRLGAADERASGPQPIIRIRPRAETPDPGLPYRRTDVPSSQPAPVAPLPPMQAVRPTPEPPRVVEKLEARTERNTVRMLGPRGTQLNPEPPHASAPALPSVVLIGAPSEAQGASGAARAQGPAPGASAAAPATDPDQAGRKAAAWQPTRPADALLALVEPPPEEAAVLVDDQAARADQPRIVARSSRGSGSTPGAVVAPSRAQDRAAERKKRLAGLPTMRTSLLLGVLGGVTLVAVVFAVFAFVVLRRRERLAEAAAAEAAPTATATAIAAPLPASETPAAAIVSAAASASASQSAAVPRAWSTAVRAPVKPTAASASASAVPSARSSSWMHDWELDEPSAKPSSSGLVMPFFRKETP